MNIEIKQQHTPTPWRLSLDSTKVMGDVTTEICDFEGAMEHMQREERMANAAFIIRAVNSHEALLQAAKGALDALMHVTGFTGDETNAADNEISILRKAIAQAEGKGE